MDITISLDCVGNLNVWYGHLWVNARRAQMMQAGVEWPDRFIQRDQVPGFLNHCAEVTDDAKILRIRPGQTTWTRAEKIPGVNIVQTNDHRE